MHKHLTLFDSSKSKENINLNKLLKEFCAIAFQEDNKCFQN